MFFKAEGVPFESEEKITRKELADPNHTYVIASMKLYSLECWLYAVLNKASMRKDYSKVKTLGPFSLVLSTVLEFA